MHIPKTIKQARGLLIITLLPLFLIVCSSTDDDVIPKDPESPVKESGLKEINQLISSASSGDVVLVESGTYLIDGKIAFKQGVSLKAKDPDNKPVFNSKNEDTGKLAGSGLNIMEYTTELSDVTIDGVEFHNIGLTIKGNNLNAENIVVKNCVFDYGERIAGTDKKNYADKYLNFVSVENVLVENCDFLRRNGVNGSGRGVQTSYTKNATIRNNRFGGENPEVTGFFVSAINDRGTNSLIDGNIINRCFGLTDLAHIDHGIYAVDFNGLVISNNTITGWPRNGAGGSIKARNGQNLVIEDNIFNTSGIIMYTYESDKIQQHFKDVIIRRNIINMEGEADYKNNVLHNGIGYYTDFTSVDGNEESIRIESNTINNGYVHLINPRINTDKFNMNGGGVYNNKAEAYLLKKGISHSGNTGEVKYE